MSETAARGFVEASRQTLEVVAGGLSRYLRDQGESLSALEAQDPAATLQRFLSFIRTAPKDHLHGTAPGRVRSLAFEMRDFRNDLMHFKPFDRESEVRFFSTAWRLLDALALPEAAAARTTLMSVLSAPEPDVSQRGSVAYST